MPDIIVKQEGQVSIFRAVSPAGRSFLRDAIGREELTVGLYGDRNRARELALRVEGDIVRAGLKVE